MKQLKFEQLIERISFAEYLVNNGYKPIKHKGKIFYGKGPNGLTDRIRIYKHKNNPNIICYVSNENEDDKGNIITFVARRINQFTNINTSNSDYAKASKVLHDYLNIPVETREKKFQENRELIQESSRDKESEPFNYHLFDAKKLENFQYLESRGIDKETLQNDIFKNSYVESKGGYYNHNTKEYIPTKNYYTAFPLFSRNNTIIGIQIHYPDKKRFGIDSDRTEGMWKSNIIKNKTNTLAIGEEAIDCISHSMLHNQENKYSYMASFGRPSSRHKNVIDKALIDNGISNLALINDNDKHGQEYNFEYIAHFINKEHSIHKVDEDKFTREVILDKASFSSTKLANMFNALKRYNIRVEKDLNQLSKDEEIKKEFLKTDRFIVALKPHDKISIKFPRLTEALFLFNKQILGLVGFRAGDIRIKIERSLTKDWNDDLKIHNKHYAKVDEIEKKNLKQDSPKISM